MSWLNDCSPEEIEHLRANPPEGLTARLRVVELHGWNLAAAARELGIARCSLQRWLANHGHTRPSRQLHCCDCGAPFTGLTEDDADGAEAQCERCFRLDFELEPESEVP